MSCPHTHHLIDSPFFMSATCSTASRKRKREASPDTHDEHACAAQTLLDIATTFQIHLPKPLPSPTLCIPPPHSPCSYWELEFHSELDRMTRGGGSNRVTFVLRNSKEPVACPLTIECALFERKSFSNLTKRGLCDYLKIGFALGETTIFMLHQSRKQHGNSWQTTKNYNMRDIVDKGCDRHARGCFQMDRKNCVHVRLPHANERLVLQVPSAVQLELVSFTCGNEHKPFQCTLSKL